MAFFCIKFFKNKYFLICRLKHLIFAPNHWARILKVSYKKIIQSSISISLEVSKHGELIYVTEILIIISNVTSRRALIFFTTSNYYSVNKFPLHNCKTFIIGCYNLFKNRVSQKLFFLRQRWFQSDKNKKKTRSFFWEKKYSIIVIIPTLCNDPWFV